MAAHGEVEEQRPANEAVQSLLASPQSSRDSVAGAGWECRHPGSYRSLVPRRSRAFSWLSPVALWRSRNDKLARWLGDPTGEQRRRWVAALPSSDFLLEAGSGDSVAFLVMGDTGEGDGSQYAVVPALKAVGGDTDFLFICSDVIYPAGGVAEYEDKFYTPYDGYPGPIFAVPGNHDWYDGLEGFMHHFCGAEPPPGLARTSTGSALRRALRRLLWRRSGGRDRRAMERMASLRAHPRQRRRQPGPYLAIDAGPLRLVGIDTGIRGEIDSDQAAWLRRVSRESRRPKILLTGKPIYVDGVHRPGTIEGEDGTVDDIVRDPAHNYIAAIGGDIHNYQRYPVTVPDGRVIQYIVNGGGGAFMHATHKIPLIRLPGVDEADFRCYPRRGDSLSFYSNAYDRRLALGLGLLRIPPDEAAALMGMRLGIAPARPGDREVRIRRRARAAARVVFPLPGHAHGPWHAVFSEFFDTNDPPMFKSFLRIDASPGQVRIRCLAATGCLEHELRPPLEDAITAASDAAGRWHWRLDRDSQGEPMP